MTREEALTEIKERVFVTEYVNSSYVDCISIEALRIAIKALEEPQWIPCSSGELPELGARVLVSDGEGVEVSQLGERYRDGYVWEFGTCWNDLEDWTMWLPFPKPPRKEGE